MSASFAPECNQVKERYDTCFLKWYSEKFVRGVAKEDECEPLFKEYKTCLTKALKDKGIEDMIAEARADNKDNDVEFMKPNSGKWCALFIILVVITGLHDADILPEPVRKEFVHFCITGGEELWRLIENLISSLIQHTAAQQLHKLNTQAQLFTYPI